MGLLKVIDQAKRYLKKEWNREGKRQERTLSETAKQFLLLFFIAMFGLSFLSRAVDSIMIAKVNVTNARSDKLNFGINGSGTLKEKDTNTIKLIQGLTIDKIYVGEGQLLKEGDAIFSYNMAGLQTLYEEKSAAIEKNKIEQEKLTLNNTQSDLKSAQISKKYAEQGVEEANDNIDAVKKGVDLEVEEAYQKALHAYEKASEEKESAIADAKQKLEEASNTVKELEAKKNGTPQADDENEIKKQEKETVLDKQIEEAKSAVETAKNNLKSVKDSWKETQADAKQSLQEQEEKWNAIKDGSYDYKTALSSANSALTAAQKSLEEADLSIESASKNQSNTNKGAALTKESIQLDIDLANKAVEELKTIMEKEGVVYAPKEGTVVLLGIKQGMTVSGSEVVSLAVDGVNLEIKVEKEEAKKINVGDSIKVQTNDSKETIEGKIEAIGVEEKEGMITCEVSIPKGDYRIGSNATFEWNKESKQYEKCIPINALREDGYQQTYILVTQKKESILGNEMQAARVDVTVLEKDTDTVAIESTIDYESQVIVGSNKEIAIGDRIRVDANE